MAIVYNKLRFDNGIFYYGSIEMETPDYIGCLYRGSPKKYKSEILKMLNCENASIALEDCDYHPGVFTCGILDDEFYFEISAENMYICNLSLSIPYHENSEEINKFLNYLLESFEDETTDSESENDGSSDEN